MSGIFDLKVHSPLNCSSVEEIVQASRNWIGDSPDADYFFQRMLRGSQTPNRHYVLPVEEIIALGGDKTRGQLFESLGRSLATSAASSLLDAHPEMRTKIDYLIFISCSSPILPSLDTLLVNDLGLPPHTRRIPIYQYGCAGGVAGLSLANDLARTGANVMLVSVEICSLVFRRSDLTPANLVGSAIFADGASAALICPSDVSLSVLASSTCTFADTRHLLGYDLWDDGAHLRLHRELPEAIAANAPQAVDDFLETNALDRKDIDHWIFHPGGQKILTTLEDEFCHDEHQASSSREVLQELGNLSSSTVLFSLRRLLDSGILKAGERIMMLAIGPGVCLEQLLLTFTP